MSIRGSIKGNVVADPTDRAVTEKLSVYSFPVYSNLRRKNRDTGEWENVENAVTKVSVEAKFGTRDEILGKISKGDFVEVTGTFYEQQYEGKNGPGRSLRTDYIESVEVIRKKDGGNLDSDGYDSDPAF